MLQIIITLLIVLGTVWIFNPYMAHRWRTDVERWTTRERSHGHPFYWLMRFGDKTSAYDFDAGCDGACPGGGIACKHRDVYNRPAKMTCDTKNVIYVQ
jgi:hypothetical protein